MSLAMSQDTLGPRTQTMHKPIVENAARPQNQNHGHHATEDNHTITLKNSTDLH